MEQYKNKYRNDSSRIKNWDYGSPGYYYVTICTKFRKHYFGDVVMCDGTQPWAGLCGGIAGTHNHASLPPTAHPSHAAAHPFHLPGPSTTHTPHAVVRLTSIGKIALQNWIDIPTHFPFVVLDEFVVMPDHIHGILCFQKPGYRERNVNAFGPQSKNLASVIRGYKAATKVNSTRNNLEFAWHHRYHDDVITSGKELDNIRAYIRRNPTRWIEKILNKNTL